VLDPALRGFVEAKSEQEAGRELESLIAHRITPLVRGIVAQKLRGFGSGGSPQEDLEDAAGDALLVLMKRLQALRAEPASNHIERLDDYTAALTYNVCAQHLRQRHPEWSQLKNRLRYVLGRDARFALWESAAGLHCGFSGWRGAAPDSDANERTAALERDSDGWPESWRPASVDSSDPAPLLDEIFTRVNGPIAFDRLVRLVAAIWQIDRASRADSGLVDVTAGDLGPEAAIDRRRFAERLWAAVRELPVRQRVALLLNLRDGRGAGVLWVLPVTGVASIRSIADTLEMSVQDLAALWGTLPIDDNTIAERLGCTRQQVINLRMSARKRLSNRLSARGQEHANARANLRRLSTSMEQDL
jgi:DNA-directed RNA polymerase specialized sigma24 family protein